MPRHLSQNLRPSSGKLLARVLETPNLRAQVRALPGPALGKLIERVGLEDAGELVALATTEQLAQIFDDDLWRSEEAGVDERFDSGRFVLWLEIFQEAGERAVAQRLAELSPDLLTLAIHRHVLVVSQGDLQDAFDDDESTEKAFESCLSEEIDDYQLIWRGGEGWDSVLSALLALDVQHHTLLVQLLERCAHLSQRHIDDEGGLYEVLSSDEMLESDVGADREQRRAERGFVAPSAAAGFLRLALGSASRETPFTERDPLTRGYFRDLAPTRSRPRKAEPVRFEVRSLERLLSEAYPDEPAPAPPQLHGRGAPAEPLVIQALRPLADAAPALFSQRSEELAYLANALVSGATFEGRRLRPVEGVEHAIACTSLGLELLMAEASLPASPRELLERYPCDGLFRLALQRARGGDLERYRNFPQQNLKSVRALLKALKV